MSTQVVFLNNSSNKIVSATLTHKAGSQTDTYVYKNPERGVLTTPENFTNESGAEDTWSFSVQFSDTIHGQTTWERGPEDFRFTNSKGSDRLILVIISDKGGDWGEHDNGPTVTVVYPNKCENWNLHT